MEKVTESKVDDLINRHLSIRATSKRWRLMYRWATVIYFNKRLTIAVTTPEDCPDKDVSIPFKEPEYESEQEDLLLQYVKRVLVWQWNDQWVVVPPDVLNALWS